MGCFFSFICIFFLYIWPPHYSASLLFTTCLYRKKIRFSVVIPDNLLIHYDWKTKIFLDQEIPSSLLFSTTENDSYYYRWNPGYLKHKHLICHVIKNNQHSFFQTSCFSLYIYKHHELLSAIVWKPASSSGACVLKTHGRTLKSSDVTLYYY